MCIGRKGKKLNYYDSIDIFLNRLKEEYKFMESRAESISSNDNICKELYERFDELKILY